MHAPKIESHDAVAGQVDRGVRPVAWWARSENGNIKVWTSAHAEALRLADEVGFQLEPLYDKAALDAAVAAERERCMHLARYALTCAKRTEWAAAEDALRFIVA